MFNKIKLAQLTAADAVHTQKTIALFLLASLATFRCEAQQVPAPDLSDASIEQLMNVEVTSASKKEQKLAKVAAAIYVLNQDDIRRSGATTIPDLLRLVPGMDVEQVSDNSWAVSARGFSNIWANKLLVLIDGRSVYNTGLSGTLWETQDVPLSDIERIEVIRGPGATVWGANAVNGVINIITKNSRDTAGGLVDVAAGNQLTEQTLVQYGGAIGNSGNYRIFGDSTANRASASNILGGPGGDPAYNYHFGFRSDWSLSQRDALLVEANLASNISNHIYNSFYSYLPPYSGQIPDTATSHTANILGKWTRTMSPSSDMALQFYYDHVDFGMYGLHQMLTTADLDFQHHFAAGSRNDIVWGLDARVQPSTIVGGYAAYFMQPAHTNWLASAFVQDEIKLNDSLWLTAGTKFENNDTTGANMQPSVRVLWAPNKKHSVWAATSRALREPSREDVDVHVTPYVMTLPNGLSGFVVNSGNPNIQAESLLAYETGYRFEPNKRASLDFSGFYNRYNNLLSIQAAGEPYLSFDANSTMPIVIIPQIFTNSEKGQTYGFEASGVVNVSRFWKLSPGYSLLHSKLDGTSVGDPYILLGDAPEQHFQLRSALNLRSNLELDATYYRVSALDRQDVPGYNRLDLRLGWRISDSFEMSFVGQNLTGHHYEFGIESATLTVPTYMGRSAYLRGTWHF